MNRILFFVAISIFSLTSSAQFHLQWKKQIQVPGSDVDYEKITALSRINDDVYFAFNVKKNGKTFPAIGCVNGTDEVLLGGDYSNTPPIEDLEIKGFLQFSGDTLIAMGNDYTALNDGLPVPRPAYLLFKKTGQRLQTLHYSSFNLTDLKDNTAVFIADTYYSKESGNMLGIHFHSPVKDYMLLYKHFMANDMFSVRTEDAVDAKIWWADATGVVVSYLTPFSKTSSKQYYQLRLYNQNLVNYKTYPDTVYLGDSTATDKLVAIDYRPAYHVGFLTRQVRNKAGLNLLNWYGFNGYENGYNKLISESSDVLLVSNIVLDPSAEVINSSNLWGGDNWVLSLVKETDRYNKLHFSMETFTALEKTNQPISSGDSPIGNINARWGTESIKSMEHQSDTTYLVVSNTINSNNEPCIYVSRWKATLTDPIYQPGYLKQRYHADIAYAYTSFKKEENRKLKIADIDETDPNYALKDELINKEAVVTDEIFQIPNTWYWRGKLKIGTKEYTFTKVVLAME